MDIKIKDSREYNGTKYFTVVLGGTEVKDCRVVNGKNGAFVSGPAKKIQSNGEDKWINLVQFSHEHSDQIVKLVGGGAAAKPAKQEDMGDVPF